MKKFKVNYIVPKSNQPSTFEYVIGIEKICQDTSPTALWFKTKSYYYHVYINDKKYGNKLCFSGLTYKKIAERIASDIEKYLHWCDTELLKRYELNRNKYGSWKKEIVEIK